MTLKQKLNQLEELLDMTKDSLNANMELEQIKEWDSMAAISVIAMFDENFGKFISPDEVKKFKTVKDITDRME